MRGERITVNLTIEELKVAAHIGVLTAFYDMEHDYPDKHGIPKDRVWDADIYGAFGEMAVAKHFGYYWVGHIGDFKCPDVGPYEVRWTACYSRAKMFLRINEGKGYPDRPYILTTGWGKQMYLMGWAYGWEVMKYEVEDKFNNDRPAHWMPLADIHPMYDVPTGEALAEVRDKVATT